MKMSVVIPVYNCENVISRCLDSILKQQCEKMEVICIDDGSTDKTAEILDAYARKDKRIKVFHEKNGGIAIARNRGLQRATGKYIYFVDADDWLAPDILQRVEQVISKENVDICFFDLYKDEEEKTRKLSAYGGREGKIPAKDSLNSFADYFRWAVVWNKVIKKELIDNNKILFKELYYLDDFLFCMNIYQASTSIYYLPHAGYHYVQNEKSITHQHEKKQVEMWKQFYVVAKDNCPISDEDSFVKFLNANIFNGVIQIYERYIKFQGSTWDVRKRYHIYKSLVNSYPYSEARKNFQFSYLSKSAKILMLTGRPNYLRLILLKWLLEIKKRI